MSQKYDKDFKIQTVRMIQEQGKPVAQFARELADNTLYRWISEFKQDPVNAFRGSGNLKMEEKTFLDMQKRIRQLEMENEILKKQAPLHVSGVGDVQDFECIPKRLLSMDPAQGK